MSTAYMMMPGPMEILIILVILGIPALFILRAILSGRSSGPAPIPCRYCGRPVMPQATVCHHCGQALAPAMLPCPNCGRMVTPGDASCPQCGRPLRPGPSPGGPQP